MAETYVPFSSSSDLISNDIQQYVPGEVNSTTQSYSCQTPRTHCYVCGTGWNYGYWKHCWCKPNPVPVGGGVIILVILAMLYALFKTFKLNK